MTAPDAWALTVSGRDGEGRELAQRTTRPMARGIHRGQFCHPSRPVKPRRLCGFIRRTAIFVVRSCRRRSGGHSRIADHGLATGEDGGPLADGPDDRAAGRAPMVSSTRAAVDAKQLVHPLHLRHRHRRRSGRRRRRAVAFSISGRMSLRHLASDGRSRARAEHGERHRHLGGGHDHQRDGHHAEEHSCQSFTRTPCAPGRTPRGRVRPPWSRLSRCRSTNSRPSRASDLRLVAPLARLLRQLPARLLARGRGVQQARRPRPPRAERECHENADLLNFRCSP